ncbi:hypothetical protein F5Y03DRAFT_144466 [Xylaria venustula]|nr:hypothetical protein F5Y03DRAFT_144466 [Xylaria venustula]
MAEPSRGKKRRRLNYNKCRFCRTAKKACTPVERAWPEKCQRCTELELDCSENTRAAGASTPIAAQLSNETINIQTIRNLSLGVACMARLKSYINAIDIVWDTQDKLFSGWRNRVHVPLRRDIIEPREALLFNKFFSEMLISNHPLAAVMVHAVMTGPSFLQRFPSGRPLVPVNELVNYFRENNDVGTALAIEEIRLLQWFESVPRRTNTARLLGYCEMYLETTDRLKAILEDGVSCMPPPLHYFLLLAKEKNLSFPITPALSEFIRMKDHFGRSLVHMTLDLGLTENVLPLIKLGISATSGDVWGRRPIHIATVRSRIP